jgi:hypothetical protein
MQTYTNNNLQNNGFTFILERIPQTIFRVTSTDIPSITVPPAQGGYPGTTQHFPGTFTEFEDITLSFIVDEDMKNYEEIYRWVVKQRFAENQVPKDSIDEVYVSDGVLTTLNNSSNPNRVFKFKAMFPVQLGNIHFDTSITSPEPVECTVTFKYSYFEMMPK